MHSTVFDGITFLEGTPQRCQAIKSISIEIGGIVQQAQLKTLDDVKRQMAIEAKSAGGNAIVNFTYGQKSVGWFRALFQLDDINWYGNGTIAVIEKTPPLPSNRREPTA